jgi:putative hydrolase of the HAD superfamily
MMTPCIVLDIDDTLYLERDYVRSGFRAVGDWVAGAFGATGFFERAWTAFEEGHRGDIFNRCLAEVGVQAADAVEQMVAVYRSHQPDIALMPDAQRFLDRVPAGRLAVITDGPLASQQAKAHALQLSRWSETIVFTAEHGPGFPKPSPRAFQFVAERLQATGRRCCYIADNPLKDFQGPKSLGWRTVRIRRRGGLHFNLLSTADVDFEIDSLDALLPTGAREPVAAAVVR